MRQDLLVLLSLVLVVERQKAPLKEGQRVSYLAPCQVAHQNAVTVLVLYSRHQADELCELLLLVLLDVLEHQFILLLIKHNLQVVHLGSSGLHGVPHALLDPMHDLGELSGHRAQVVVHRRALQGRQQQGILAVVQHDLMEVRVLNCH